MDPELLEAALDEGREHMQKAVAHTQSEFASIRTGRAAPALVERLRVDYYGSEVPLQQIAGVIHPDGDDERRVHGDRVLSLVVLAPIASTGELEPRHGTKLQGVPHGHAGKSAIIRFDNAHASTDLTGESGPRKVKLETLVL